MSGLNKRVIGRVYDRFKDPYKVSKEVGVATYQLVDIQQPGRIGKKLISNSSNHVIKLSKHNGEERGKVSERDGFTDTRKERSIVSRLSGKTSLGGETNSVQSTSNVGSKVGPTKHKNHEI